MDLGIAGKVALVTAASKGLGRASAEALAADGVKVVICARGQEALDTTAASIRAAGGEVTAIPVEAYGGLDILVGNAGGPPPGAALDVTEDGLDSALNANLRTSIRLAQAAIPHMRGWGRVVFITSVSVRQPIGGLALSNVARTGLWAWAKTAAQDLRETGITVNLACPGSHATDRMKELSHGSEVRMGDPGDFGKVVAFLCSQPAAFVNGIAMGVDGGAVAGLL
jgi:3-oxoacyl-[acyl-carrier protein] reductase